MVNFRKYTLETGREILAGRDAHNNDELCFEAKPKDVMLHTDAPGSPFVNLGEEPSKTEVKEAAIFCAKYSQDWRDNKRDIIVGKFMRSDMNKEKKMKPGTWGVSKKDNIKVKKSDILKLEKDLKENRN